MNFYCSERFHAVKFSTPGIITKDNYSTMISRKHFQSLCTNWLGIKRAVTMLINWFQLIVSADINYPHLNFNSHN